MFLSPSSILGLPLRTRTEVNYRGCDSVHNEASPSDNSARGIYSTGQPPGTI